LLEVLAAGPQKTADVERWAHDRGISSRTLDRAYRPAGVTSYKRGHVWHLSITPPGQFPVFEVPENN
jgi:hypothetical protein